MTVVLAAATASAWQPAPGMKTPWGEKVSPENAWREYPRPQMVRANWTNLNGLWQYAVTKDAPGCPAKWDGEILVPFVIESSLSGVGRLLEPKETLWYRRSFDADVKPGERLLIHFEQTDFRAMVYVNGRELDVPHEGGQMPFSYDVTDFVKKGANELVVSVWDPTTDTIGSCGKQVFKPGGCSYTRSSGIGGTVWLETVPAVHIANYKVTPDVDAGTVRFTFDVAGGGFTKPEVRVSVQCDGGNAVVTTKDGVAMVNRKRCIGCGLCVKACPRGLIELVPASKRVIVQCSNHDKGPLVKKVCTAGCIGCMLCTKQCEFDAIHVTGNLAQVNYDNCTQCGKCAQKCPVKVITLPPAN